MTIVVLQAQKANIRPLAALLARAFEDDPMMTWLFTDAARRRRRLSPLFELALRHPRVRAGEVYTTADLAGVALWAPPDQWRTPIRNVLRALPQLIWTLRGGLPAAVRTTTAIERVHPREPHWYLAVLGTEPARQGQGIGSALLAPVLQRCDRDAIPAYLESSKEANVAFYQRHGFEVTGTVATADGGPTVWLMWREPRP